MSQVNDLADWRDAHQGTAAVVIGGGPTLLDDIDELPDGVWIGVNQHALLLQLDYIVYHDAHFEGLFSGHPAFKVTHVKHHCEQGGARYIWGGIFPQFHFSGAKAVWLADWFGCDPIILTGFDVYQGDRDYWHDLPGSRRRDRASYMQNFEPWRKVREHLRHPERVRVLSGPLKEVFSDG